MDLIGLCLHARVHHDLGIILQDGHWSTFNDGPHVCDLGAIPPPCIEELAEEKSC